ncbi:MAG TPA: hybrid-cluster NAD(P)-dependent oxidoreductase [Salinisphaeraceae bacterium]|nr:hybrid-cluster NAD(P)-dependent oxidoreductase [Salinisphaeraceae bacterium]
MATAMPLERTEIANMQSEGLLLSHLNAEYGTWDAEIDDVLVCRRVLEETHDVKTFLFRGQQPQDFRYLPGQFLTFDFEIDGENINRCFTISSTPTRPHLLSITCKRTPGGPVSNWLHDHFKPGMELRAVGPLGEFSTLNHPAEKYLFLAGGSGITPLMSMARAYYDLALPRNIVFAEFARTPADIIFRAELNLIAWALPNFRFFAVCEDDAPRERWGGLLGRVSLPTLRQIAPDFMEREIMVCGPAPFMAAVRDILTEAGFDMTRYHEESFDFADHTGAEAIDVPAMPAPAQGSYSIEFTGSGSTVECGADTTVLAAASVSGIQIPSFCSQGLCGTCKSRLVSGEVDMQHQGGIRQREIDKGMFLPCCSKPLSDLVVER